MDSGFLLIENFARLAILVGLAVSVPLFAWGGYLYMSSMGDPNRSAQARNAVISVGIGVIIIGCSFILPLVISQFVVAPSGGIHREVEGSVNCDGVLREQLVVHREVSNGFRMNYLISQIQSRHDDCNGAFWDPEVYTGVTSHIIPIACFDDGHGMSTVAGVVVPTGLQRGGSIVNRSGRDAHNNIILHWVSSHYTAGETMLPSDGATCWMYVSALATWVSGYR